MAWRHRGSPHSKKFRVQKSAGYILASIFWDQDGIPLIDYLPKGQTINAEYYSSLLVQLKDVSKEKGGGNFAKGVLFLHDNAPTHRTIATEKKLAYLGFQCLDHPPYSPYLTPSDYHLFPGLKKIDRSPFFGQPNKKTTSYIKKADILPHPPTPKQPIVVCTKENR